MRALYKPTDWLGLGYWITNGTQQVEPFNGYKDQFASVSLQSKTVNWTGNYYNGQEHPDFEYVTNPGPGDSSLPSLQGMPFRPIRPAPDGRLHILDTYASWQATPTLLLAAEADYAVERLFRYSPPQHVTGGAAYARYQFTPVLAAGARSEYFSDRGGLFSGTSQALKEVTVTLEQKIAQGFLMREEWRRDFSNQPYFLTDTLGVLSRSQTTATLGITWWFGPKQGAW